MDPMRKVVRNSSALMASNVLGKGLSFFYVLLAARYLGAKGYGLLAFSLSFCSLFKVIIDLGFVPLIVKDVARDRSLAALYLRKVLYIKIYLFVAALAMITIAMRLLGYTGQESLVIYIFFAFIVLQSYANTGYAALRALEEIHYVALGETLMGAIILAGFIVLTYGGYGVVAFSSVYVVSGCAVVLYSAIMAKRAIAVVPLKADTDTRTVSGQALMKASLPFALMSAFYMILFYLDSVMLGIFRTQAEVGLYGVAYRSAIVLVFVPLAVHVSLVPVISRLFGEGSDNVARNVGRFFRYNLILGVPLGVGGSLLAWRLIPMVFGEQYNESSLIFAILIWSLVFSFMRFPFNTLFEATDRQSMLARVFAFAVVLNILLNSILIPDYGMVGAAAATVFTDMVLALIVMFFGIKADARCLTGGLWMLILKVSLASSVMGLACMLALRLGVVFSVFTGALVYSILIWVSNSLEDDDKVLIKRILGR